MNIGLLYIIGHYKLHHWRHSNPWTLVGFSWSTSKVHPGRRSLPPSEIQ